MDILQRLETTRYSTANQFEYSPTNGLSFVEDISFASRIKIEQRKRLTSELHRFPLASKVCSGLIPTHHSQEGKSH